MDKYPGIESDFCASTYNGQIPSIDTTSHYYPSEKYIEYSDGTSFEESGVKVQFQQLLCPIGKTLMKDPVMIGDGLIYDRANITGWFSENGCISPSNRNPVENGMLEKTSLKLEIQKYMDFRRKEDEDHTTLIPKLKKKLIF